LSEKKHKQAMENEYNFDSPDAFDIECIVYTLRRLKEGKSVEIPVYNFTTHRIEKKKVIFLPYFYPCESDGICFHRCWFVCLSVTTISKMIVDGFVPNFMGRFLGEREDQVHVLL